MYDRLSDYMTVVSVKIKFHYDFLANKYSKKIPSHHIQLCNRAPPDLCVCARVRACVSPFSGTDHKGMCVGGGCWVGEGRGNALLTMEKD